jgi:serine/threonine protein kinase
MGRVWLARDEVLRRDVAIKEIALPFGLTDEEREEMRARTLREARAAARLSHPNVVRTYDVQHGDERPWIVMEYIPSRSLQQVIKENGPLPPKEAAGIGLAVLSALEAADRVGVMHRDVKPSNVLIADDGRVLLTDFGAAMMDEGEGALTQTGIILGSPRYISPERAATGISTLESDLWSLGATLYEAVEGRAPYTRETTLATLVALATEKPDPVQRAGPLKPVITGLLQKNPKARMRLPEVEERLRRIADVQTAVRLHYVPAARTGTGTNGSAVSVTPDEVVARLDALALPAGPAQAGAPAGADSLPLSSPAVVSASAPVSGSAVVSRSAPVPISPAAAPASSVSARIPPAVPRHRRRWGMVAVGLAAAAALTGGSAVYILNGNLPWTQDERPQAAAAAVPDDTPAPSTVASASASPAPLAVLPAGFKWYDSRSGFHLPWPATWTKIQESRTSVTLCAPGGPPVVAVREWIPSDPDLGAAMRREETAAALPLYKRLRMEVAPQQDRAEWEYTFTDPKMGALHGLDRAVVLGGRSYLIQWRTPAARWISLRASRHVVLDNFRGAAAPVASNTAVPAGFVRYQSASGFQMAAPAKWGKIEETRTSVVFCAPGGPPAVGVRAWAPSNVDLSVALRREEELAKLPGYKRVDLTVLSGQQGAVWEYTFTDPKFGRLHGLERAFLTPNGTAYLLQWRTPINKWAVNLANLGVVTSSFRAAAQTE